MSGTATLSPELRAHRARLGGYATASRHNPADYTRAGLTACHGLDRFLKDVDPNLPEPERIRRAEAGRKLWYQRLSFQGIRARQTKRDASANVQAAEASLGGSDGSHIEPSD